MCTYHRYVIICIYLGYTILIINLIACVYDVVLHIYSLSFKQRLGEYKRNIYTYHLLW